MGKQIQVLTDVASGKYQERVTLGQAAGMSNVGWSVTKDCLKGGKQHGVDVVDVDNGRLKFRLLPTRGMGIWKAWLGELEAGWNSPVKGPVHPAFVPVAEPSGLGWLHGFDELLVRCGLQSNGAPEFDKDGKLEWPLHGRIANVPAHYVDVAIDDDSEEITVTGIVDETRMYGSKLRLKTQYYTRFNEPTLYIADEVTNLSAEPSEFQLLYHVNFGEPLLDEGSKVVAPVKTLVPRDAAAVPGVATWDSYPAGQAGFKEQVYYFQLLANEDGRTQTLLRNAHGNQGVSLQFNIFQLPGFVLWKSPQLAADGYVTGLEPGVNLPNPRSYEKAHDRVVPLAPGESYKFELAMRLHPNAESVAQVEESIRMLQQAATPNIFDKPQPGWSPAGEG